MCIMYVPMCVHAYIRYNVRIYYICIAHWEFEWSGHQALFQTLLRTLPIEKGDGQVTIVCCIVASVGITVSCAVGCSVPADWPWGHSLHTPFVIWMLHRPKERRCLSNRHHSPKAWRGRWPSQDTTSIPMWRTSVCWQRRPHPKKLWVLSAYIRGMLLRRVGPVNSIVWGPDLATNDHQLLYKDLWQWGHTRRGWRHTVRTLYVHLGSFLFVQQPL